jgi:isocitrate dehydrogenase (NAD+)
MTSRIEATLIPGDGIGPEIVEAVQIVLDGLGLPVVWDVRQAGMAAIQKVGDPLPADTLDSIRRTRPALKVPLTTPIGDGFRSVNVRLREEFGLYANVRPVRTIIPGQRYDNIDLVLIRENLEGLYIGFEHYVPIGNDPHAVAIASGVNTKAGAYRVIEFAFDYALRNGRKKVTVIHKANVLKALTGLFLEVGRDVAKEYEGRIEMNDRIVDACAMQLVLDPWQFDVIVSTNLFGDILSDEMAGLVGGLGLAPGANIAESAAIFEAGARLGTGHHRQGYRQSCVLAARGRADARTCRKTRRGAASAACNRPRDQSGQHTRTRYRRPRIDARVRRSRRRTSLGDRALSTPALLEAVRLPPMRSRAAYLRSVLTNLTESSEFAG